MALMGVMRVEKTFMGLKQGVACFPNDRPWFFNRCIRIAEGKQHC
jgi:hypothetical protein